MTSVAPNTFPTLAFSRKVSLPILTLNDGLLKRKRGKLVLNLIPFKIFCSWHYSLLMKQLITAVRSTLNVAVNISQIMIKVRKHISLYQFKGIVISQNIEVQTLCMHRSEPNLYKIGIERIYGVPKLKLMSIF